ncbi:MAG: sugar phosphate isomerase/epimerase [Opitutus sp.]
MAYSRTFSTLGCPDLSLEETFDLARRHGLPGVELRALKGTIDLVTHFTATYGSPESLAEKLRDESIKILSLDTSLKLAGGTDADREAFLTFIPWAEALGVPWRRVFDGGTSADTTAPREMAKTVAWWRVLKSENNWRTDMMIETHDALFTAAAINQFLRLAPGTAILWDTHHTWKKGGEDPVKTWSEIRAHVVHVHVKDSVSIPSEKHPFSYRLPGDGEFPMAPLRELLRAEFSGPMSLEWERLWLPSLGPLDEVLTAATQRGWW